MKDAIVAVEDKRFWTDPGVDIRGIARALRGRRHRRRHPGCVDDRPAVRQERALRAEQPDDPREAARGGARLPPDARSGRRQKILTEYLNSIYFGNGAYGVESAARVYFGKVHGLDGVERRRAAQRLRRRAPHVDRPRCASVLAPWEAALLAGMVANPSAFDPIAHPQAAMARRNLVLQDMLASRATSRKFQYDQGISEPLPTAADIEQPEEPTAAPYFTSWLRPQILAAMGAGTAFPPGWPSTAPTTAG